MFENNSTTAQFLISLLHFMKVHMLKCRYEQPVLDEGIWKWQNIFEMWVSGSGPIIHEATGVERAREQERSEMWGGIQSLGLIFYSEHVHSPLHLSVPSNNSSGLAACLPASLVNHAVFASDLAKIVAGLYIYAARLQERPETI